MKGLRVENLGVYEFNNGGVPVGENGAIGNSI
jgi:hypothetical protein